MTLDPDPMSAQHDPTTSTTTPAGGAHREGVKAVRTFSRRAERKRAASSERKRAWDQLSEIDRAVLLESVRQRREAAEQRRARQQSLSSAHLR
jgi:hypothetical protein